MLVWTNVYWFGRDNREASLSPSAPTEGPLAEVEAAQVIGLGAALLVAQHQLPSVPTAKTLVLGLLLALRLPLAVLPLGPLTLGLGRHPIRVLQGDSCHQSPG